LNLGECAICFEGIKVGGTLKCGHVIDYDCLQRSLSTQPNTCPICRQWDRRPPVKLYFDRGLGVGASGPHGETPAASEDAQSEGAEEKRTLFRSRILDNIQASLTETQVMLDQVLAQLTQEQEEKQRLLKRYRFVKERLAEYTNRHSLAFVPDLNTGVSGDERRKTRVSSVGHREGSSTRRDQDVSSSTLKTRERKRQSLVDDSGHSSKWRPHHHEAPDVTAGPSGSRHRPATPPPNPTPSREEPLFRRSSYTVPTRQMDGNPSPTNYSACPRPHRGTERGRNYQSHSQQRAVVIIDADPAPSRKRARHST